MMDRFNFRVWDNIHERYIYCDFAGYCSVDYSGKGEKRIVFMPSGVEQVKNGRPLLYAKEDEAKIEQCTGLKDKNGKLIYEGDIVKINGWWNACGPAGYDKNQTIVKWNKELAGFEPMCIYDCDCGVYHNAEKCEIIGNIHENADLLDK